MRTVLSPALLLALAGCFGAAPTSDPAGAAGGGDPDGANPGDAGSGDTGTRDTGARDTGAGEPGDGDTGGGDTGGGDTGGGDTGGGDTGAAPEPWTAHHVVASIEVGARTDGFDLDGDGSVDNALFIAGAVLDPALDQALGAAPVVLVLQCADLDDWTDDEAFSLGLVAAQDTDGDPSDNASGSEAFAPVAGAVDGDGHATISTALPLESGRYDGELSAATLPVGDLELPLATPLRIAGAPTGATHDAVIGVGIDTDALVRALEATPYADAAALVEGLSDLDTDGDGTDDAISAAFLVTAVACELM